jgi:hypothetical protein
MQQANEMANAAANANYNLVLKYTYPQVMKDYTKEEALYLITETMKNLKSNEFEIESTIIGEAGTIFNAGKELHCLLPAKIIIKPKQGRFQKDSFLLAVSIDDGQNWFFADCSAGKENLMTMFPHFNDELIIPKKSSLLKLVN